MTATAVSRRRRRTLWFVLALGFRSSRRAMGATLALGLASALAMSFTPLAIALFTDSVVEQSASGLAWATLLVVATIGFTFIAGILASMTGSRLSERVDIYLAVEWASLVNQASSIEHFERPEYLRELDLLESRRAEIAGGPRGFVQLLSALVLTTVSVLLLWLVAPVLALLPVFAFAPFLAARASARLTEKIDALVAEKRRLANQLFNISSTASAAPEIRIYGLGSVLVSRHEQLGKEISRTIVSGAVKGAFLSALGWAVVAGAIVSAVILVAIRAANGEATVGDVVLVMTVGQRIGRQVLQIADTAGEMLEAVKGARRVLWLVDYAAGSSEPNHAQVSPPKQLTDGIYLDNVSFVYPGTDTLALDGISCRLPAGATVALVGENGAGKTTLTKLLTAMYRPTGGSIHADQIDLARVSAASWRSGVSAVFQDFMRYELIAREAIGVGDLPRVGDGEAVSRAIERASAVGLVDSLDDGLETELGRSFTGGLELSGGQWQKIALARGMMRDWPLLLILDEPTASLDPSTEHRLFQRFASAAGRVSAQTGGITILVSHRFSTVRMADLIIVLDQGRILEVGTHADLLANGAMYSELFSLQARGYQ